MGAAVEIKLYTTCLVSTYTWSLLSSVALSPYFCVFFLCFADFFLLPKDSMALLRNLSRLRQLSTIQENLSVPLCNNRLFHGYTNEPTHSIPGKEPRWMSAEEAVSVVKSGNLFN